jgi:hypothetical protein
MGDPPSLVRVGSRVPHSLLWINLYMVASLSKK